MAKESDLLLAKKLRKNMKTRKSQILGKQVMVEGMMAFGKLENG